MKKTVIFFAFCIIAVGARAQSTCETRVDAHQRATTNQRVNYCLVPGYGEEARQGPHLIFSSSNAYTVPQAAPSRPLRATAKKGSFDDADIEVTHSFVQTRQFPKFADDHVSEQYKREYREAMVSGPETAQEAIAHTECEPEEEVVWIETDGKGETKAGIKARQKKPGRRLLISPSARTTPVATSSVTTGLENVEEVAALADQYTYEDSSYAPVSKAGQSPYQTSEYVPAGIADVPSETSQDIAAGAYSYVPAAPTQTTVPESAVSVSDEIAAGKYSYEPASYGSTVTSTASVADTEAVSTTTEAATAKSDEIAVGEYSYAPASYGSTVTSTTSVADTSTVSTTTETATAKSDEIAVGEYSYAPASYGSTTTPANPAAAATTPAANTKEIETSTSDEIAVGEYSYAPAQ